MGWNQGFTIMEATVIGAYDLGKLDRELLAVLLEPYRYTDIDSGGKLGTLTKDGKDVEQVVVEAWGLKMPAPPDVPMPDISRWQAWTEAENADADAWDQWGESCVGLFNQVTAEFGW